ncbi:MAG: hypothetical protein RL711_571 [Bacteroidota bacterium]
MRLPCQYKPLIGSKIYSLILYQDEGYWYIFRTLKVDFVSKPNQ